MANGLERWGGGLVSDFSTMLRKGREGLSDAFSRDKYLKTAREALTELGISPPEGTPLSLERDLQGRPEVRISFRTPEQEIGGGIFCDIEVYMDNRPFGPEIKIRRWVSTPDIDAETILHFQSGLSIIMLWLKVDRVGEIKGVDRPSAGMFRIFRYASTEKKKNITRFNDFLAGFQKTPELSAYIPKEGKFDWKATVKGLVAIDLNAPSKELLGLGVVIPTEGAVA